MGDIALTAAKIAVVDPMEAIIETYIAGEAITQGQFLYGIISRRAQQPRLRCCQRLDLRRR